MSSEPTLQRVLLVICDLCLGGAGGECHVPGCSFYLNRGPDLPLVCRHDWRPSCDGSTCALCGMEDR